MARVPNGDRFGLSRINRQQLHGIEALVSVEKLARAAGVPVKSVHVTDDYPASAILATAKKEKCDLIYMASHGRTGFHDSLLGSQTQKVLAQSRIPVLVHR